MEMRFKLKEELLHWLNYLKPFILYLVVFAVKTQELFNNPFMSSMIFRKIICLTLGLMVVLSLIRARVMNFYLLEIFRTPELIPKVIIGSYYDWMFAVLTGGVFIMMSFLIHKKQSRLPLLSKVFFAFILINIFFAVINIRVVQLLGVPFNIQWFYYSDFLGNNESKAELANISWELPSLFLFLSASALIIGYLLNYILDSGRFSLRSMRFVIISLGLLLATYFISVPEIKAFNYMKYKCLANPTVAFVESFFISSRKEAKLFDIHVPKNFEPPKCGRFDSNREGLKSFQLKKIRNVIIFVMESVPAEYIAGYNNKYPVTPNIEKYLKQSMLVTDVYAHVPSTNNSLVTMLGSIYPMISYKSISKEYPEINWPTLSSELKNNNYRTAFFSASDNRFQRADEFLAYREFDKIADYRDLSSQANVLHGSTPGWKYLDGVDEEYLVSGFMDWLKGDDASRPFFGMLWTMQTHYPYFTSGQVKDYHVDNEELNRYLNALHHSDEMLGKLLDGLKLSGLSESTLIVVVGDHGEAFGRHDQVGHGGNIFEENIHVPFILINPVLFHGQKLNLVGGLVDIAPTIMDLIGLPSPKEWEGSSFFDTTRINRAYFFNPFSEYLFGYRTPEYKVIFNASSSKTMIFDMKIDPTETRDIADKMPGLVKLSYFRLGRWVQTHSAVLKETINRTAEKKEADINFHR